MILTFNHKQDIDDYDDHYNSFEDNNNGDDDEKTHKDNDDDDNGKLTKSWSETSHPPSMRAATVSPWPALAAWWRAV